VYVDRENRAAVAVGRGVGALVKEAKAGKIADGDCRADEVSGLVKALGPLNRSKVIHPCDDEAAVRKGSHVAQQLQALLIEDVDENVARDEVATGIIDRGADVQT